MLKKIGTKNIRDNMGEILDCVNLRGDEYLIERKNKPLAVLIPVRKFQMVENFARRFLAEFLEGQPDELSEEKLFELIEEAKEQTRKKISRKKRIK